jgi:hypothetical protein
VKHESVINIVLGLRIGNFSPAVALWQYFFFSNGSTAPSGAGPPHFRGFTITLRHATLSRTPLNERSPRRRDLPDNTQHSQETNIHAPAGFEPAIPVPDEPQAHALDRVMAVFVIRALRSTVSIRMRYIR